jgi:uncharacterized RDD family membrane protein YckC
MIRRPPEAGLAGHYAGPVTRLAAYAADVALVWFLFAGLSAATVEVVELVAGTRVDPSDLGPIGGTALLLLWGFLYFWVPLSMSGKTPGMALLGLRVVRRDGGNLDRVHAALRVAALPLGFLTLGLGFVGIVLGREHRALHDVVAGTAVVYDWDARAARLRFLARQPASDA